MADRLTPDEERALRGAVLQASARGWALAMGLLLGIGLFLATIVLVVKDGPHRGAHLNLLRIYFPGYSVTTIGACIGFVYAFVVGNAVGWFVATIYNRVTALLPR